MCAAEFTAACDIFPGYDPAFTKKCPAGEWVTQFRVRFGSWLDQLTITCSGGSSLSIGGNGGGPGGPYMSNNGFKSALVFEIYNSYISGLLLYPFTTGASPITAGNGFGDGQQSIACSTGKRFVGIHGKGYNYVESLGFICG